jgi:hypothetical protein
VVATVTVISPGVAEGIWCTINANFITQIVGVAVSAVILVSVPTQLLRLSGPDYEVQPWSGQTPEEAQAHTATKASVESNRRRRRYAYAAGIATLLAGLGSFIVWILINLAVDGNTKCADIHGKIISETPNLVAILIVLFIIAVFGRLLTWFVSRDLPVKAK